MFKFKNNEIERKQNYFPNFKDIINDYFREFYSAVENSRRMFKLLSAVSQMQI